jgi:hypothetical protein
MAPLGYAGSDGSFCLIRIVPNRRQINESKFDFSQWGMKPHPFAPKLSQ